VKSNPTANLVEVFSAIQGEGLIVGTRQIFIRFGRCDLRCWFCDSAHTWETSPTCQIEQTPGRRDFITLSNPVDISTLLYWVGQQNQPRIHDSISLTGGEPLLHASFLQAFLPVLREATKLPIYLETGGHRPQQLALILPYLDWVGMDMKLPSVSGENRWQAHRDFLGRCYEAGVKVFVKLILSEDSDRGDLERAAEIITSVARDIPLVLQPVTPIEAASKTILPPTAEQILHWQQLFKQSLWEVRVVPQTHKFIGQL